MLGYDISWAGFNVIEVMSSSKFTHKRIGYLAASQSFHADLEMLMLTTNMIRKDLSSQNQYEAGVALSALSCFVSPDLARDLSNDIMVLVGAHCQKKSPTNLQKSELPSKNNSYVNISSYLQQSRICGRRES